MFQTPSLETTTTTGVLSHFDLEKTINLVPSEGKKPISILNNLYCKEKDHLYLFLIRKYGYKIKRDIPLSPREHFNERLFTNICC